MNQTGCLALTGIHNALAWGGDWSASSDPALSHFHKCMLEIIVPRSKELQQYVTTMKDKWPNMPTTERIDAAIELSQCLLVLTIEFHEKVNDATSATALRVMAIDNVLHCMMDTCRALVDTLRWGQ